VKEDQRYRKRNSRQRPQTSERVVKKDNNFMFGDQQVETPNIKRKKLFDPKTIL
jgi:hypothetical protein